MEKPEPNPHNPGPDDTTFVGEYLVDPSQVSLAQRRQCFFESSRRQETL